MEILTDKDNYKKRLETCEKCEHKSVFNICKLCGCFVIAKAKIKNSNCPINKWPQNISENNDIVSE
jgi:hypothetical protein